MINAKSDYAVRAVCQLALADGRRSRGEDLARDAVIPRQFLENIMGELRAAGIVRTRRGADGGYELAHDPAKLDVAAVLAAVGSAVAVEAATDDLMHSQVAELWLALRGTLHEVIERVTIGDLVSNSLPEDLRRVAAVERRRRG